jgi:hypothetical protein
MIGFSYLAVLGFAFLAKSPVYILSFLSLGLAFPLVRDLKKALENKSINWASLLGRGGQWALLHGVLVSISHLLI